MQRLQDQLSSGKLISKPSDSPTGTVSALKLRADLRRGEQLERNANDSIAWLSAADSTMFEGLSVFSRVRSEEHTSELQSLMRISYAVFCLKKKNTQNSY